MFQAAADAPGSDEVFEGTVIFEYAFSRVFRLV
jgi:hypothetical protein